MSADLDDHGQPLDVPFNRARRFERDISELLGLAKGLLADGEVSVAEADLIAKWIEGHPVAAEQWPVNRIAERLEQIYADGRVEDHERRDLRDLLRKIVGGEVSMIGGRDVASALPLDVPAPILVWTGSIFVFTGQMAFGPRHECERHVEVFGGMCERTITKRTSYLIIGTFGSRDWAHTSFGRKIQKAVEYRSAGVPLAIVGEDHWAEQLPAHVNGNRVVTT